MYEKKILTKEQFSEIRKDFRQKGQIVVLCHGVFDLLHYGHIEHLQDAKKQGDILVVSVTAAKYVNKGPGRPYFNDYQRMEFLSNLEAVDYVILSEAVTVHDIVRCVQPDIYAKGREYQTASNDITGNIGSEERIVRQYGGTIYYTQGEVYSSTKILNNFFSALPENVVEMSRELTKTYGESLMSKLREDIEKWKKLKVLVVGDLIIDEYIFCQIQGVTMKDGCLSTLYESKERYTGGAMAIAKHIAGFCENVTLCSMVGTEHGLMDYVTEHMDGIQLELLQDEKMITPIKTRYLKRNPIREEYDKLFSNNHLMNQEEKRVFDYTKWYEYLKEQVPGYDMVVVGDFGHGLIDEGSIQILQENAKFLCINCQTNSSNMGTNIITKYSRADMFVVDERELRLASGQNNLGRTQLVRELAQKLKSRYAWVTIGADGAIGVKDGEECFRCPAMTLHVKDTVGAGDAFYSIASICAASDFNLDLATFVSNTAGAIKTNVLGNKESVKKVDVLKFISTILNI